MASKSKVSMKHQADRKTRGRTSIGQHAHPADQRIGPRATKPNVPEVLRAEATRPQGTGVKHRGDRRDMNPLYTGNMPHRSGGNLPRIDVKTRKR